MKFNLSLFFILLYAICSAQTNNTVLWKISGKNIEKPSYVLGTIHIPQKQFIEFSDSVYAAIRTTDYFFGEVNFLNGFVNELSSDEGRKFLKEKEAFLDSAVKTGGWKQLVQRINRDHNKNINPSSLQEFLSFSQELLADLYRKDAGVEVPDLMLMTFASKQGKQIGGLETILFQMDMLYKIIEERLVDTSMGFSDEAILNKNMMRYYKAQQLDSINYILEIIHPRYRTIIFDDRNTTMVDSMLKQMKVGPTFFAVGCGHLTGKTGVIELLRRKGYLITPVHSATYTSLLVVNEQQKTIVAPATAEDTEVEEITSVGRIVQEPAPPPPPQSDPPGMKFKKKKKKQSRKN
jgi:uncharacterized protein